MSTTKQYNSLGLKATISNIPADVEEFDANAGRQGACLEEGVNNVVYRSGLAEWREKFTEKVQEETGIERETKPGKAKKDGTIGEDQWAQTEGEYMRKVCSTNGVEPDSFQHIADMITVEFDASKPEPTERGPKKAPKRFVEAATAATTAGKGDKLAGILSDKLGREVGSDVDSLAQAMHEDHKRTEAAYLAGLGL